MQPLSLNQQQNDKLLEMCKVLFPEHIAHLSVLTHNARKNIFFVNRKYIHFYELMWQILNKICELYIKSPVKMAEQVSLFGMVCFNRFKSLHPVDYLYGIFKEQSK